MPEKDEIDEAPTEGIPMNEETQHVEPTQVEDAQFQDETPDITPMSLLRTAQMNGADVAVLEKYMDLVERREQNEARKAFMAAMARVQAQLPVILRTTENTQTNSRYAKEDAISRVIKPVYTQEGFSLTFDTGDCPREGHMRILCDVLHSEGHAIQKHIDYPYDATGIKGTTNKTQIHAYASTFQYGRRALVCAIFNVATGDDDDGNAAGQGEMANITPEQAAALEVRLAAVDANVPKFLELFHVEKVEDLPASSLERASQMLDAKESQCKS